MATCYKTAFIRHTKRAGFVYLSRFRLNLDLLCIAQAMPPVLSDSFRFMSRQVPPASSVLILENELVVLTLIKYHQDSRFPAPSP